MFVFYQLDHILKIWWRNTYWSGCPTYLPVVPNLDVSTPLHGRSDQTDNRALALHQNVTECIDDFICILGHRYTVTQTTKSNAQHTSQWVMSQMKYKPTKLQGQLITVMLVVFSMKKKLIIMNIYLGLLNEVKLKFFRKKKLSSCCCIVMRQHLVERRAWWRFLENNGKITSEMSVT